MKPPKVQDDISWLYEKVNQQIAQPTMLVDPRVLRKILDDLDKYKDENRILLNEVNRGRTDSKAHQ